jgi:hypothetical protein
VCSTRVIFIIRQFPSLQKKSFRRFIVFRRASSSPLLDIALFPVGMERKGFGSCRRTRRSLNRTHELRLCCSAARRSDALHTHSWAAQYQQIVKFFHAKNCFSGLFGTNKLTERADKSSDEEQRGKLIKLLSAVFA